jgi:tetrapyrrole methylase family protein/MazG family protein
MSEKSMSITIVGLGPGDPELLTRRAWRVLSEASEVYLRTARHPGIEALPPTTYRNFDDLYDQAENFDTLYKRIAAQVVELGQRDTGVTYAVPGHPLMGETTVTHILKLAAEAHVPVTIVDGLSFLEPTLNAVGIDGLDGLQIHDAIDLAVLHHPPLNPDLPVILAQVYSHAIASDVKLTLANQYPDEHLVTLIHGAGTAQQALETVPLWRVDHSKQISHLTSLYVPPLPRAGSFERFQETIAHLRAPEGCPWDQKQTHLSLRQYLLEETYEALEAIDAEDSEALKEELGDVLLQIVLHSQIAVDDGEFRMADILEGINTKIIRRHPHVWGDVKVDDAEGVKANWETLKKQEKAAKNPGEAETHTSILDGVPKTLPALLQAFNYRERAARVGFDWAKIEDVYDTLQEEITELKMARTDAETLEELGDVLFSVVNLAGWLKADPEMALRGTNRKFARRFGFVEQSAGDSLKTMSLEDMDALWKQAKQAEKRDKHENTLGGD